MRKTPLYLRPAGQKWLKQRYAQLVREGAQDIPAKIGAELLEHDGDLIAPRRKRGRKRLDEAPLEVTLQYVTASLHVFKFGHDRGITGEALIRKSLREGIELNGGSP